MGLGSIVKSIATAAIPGADIAAIAAPVIGGLFGGKKQGAVTSQSIPPFEQWPEEVQKKWLDKVIGGASAATTENPFDPIPMTRVGAPQTPLDSQALYDWQRFSDSRGGLFSSLFPDDKKPATSEDATSKETTIISFTPAAQKGGAPGFYMLSDGSKVMEQDFDPSKLPKPPGMYGVGALGERLIGQKYSK